jgi:hypothetical protein
MSGRVNPKRVTKGKSEGGQFAEDTSGATNIPSSASKAPIVITSSPKSLTPPNFAAMHATYEKSVNAKELEAKKLEKQAQDAIKKLAKEVEKGKEELLAQLPPEPTRLAWFKDANGRYFRGESQSWNEQSYRSWGSAHGADFVSWIELHSKHGPIVRVEAPVFPDEPQEKEAKAFDIYGNVYQKCPSGL